MGRTSLRAGFALALSAALLGSSVRAQESDERVERARSLFREGVQLTKQNRWAQALDLFTRSGELRPHARTSHNMAYCERALGRLTRAYKLFGLALAQDASRSKAELDDAQRLAAEEYRSEISRELARADLVLAEDALITVDGRPLERLADDTVVAGTRPVGPAEAAGASALSVLVDPGAHVFVVRFPQREAERTTVRFAKGERRALRFENVVAPAAPSSAVARRHDAAASGWGLSQYTAVGMGLLGVASSVTGTVLALRASSRWDEAKQECPGLTDCSGDEASRLADDARTDANLATLALGVGVSSLVAGAVLWFAVSESGAGRVGLVLAPGSASIRSAF